MLLIISRKLCMVKYWIKLLKADDDVVPKKMYSMLKADVDNNMSYSVSYWVFQIKSILDSIELSYIWIQQSEIEIPFNLTK